MNKMKCITKATIETVKGSQLKEGDFILVADRKCRVISVPFYPAEMVKFESEDGCINSEGFESGFMNYYRIIDCEEKDIYETQMVDMV